MTEPRGADDQRYLDGLGRRVRHMRAVRGMSRKVLARVSGISERYIAQLEGGKGNVSIMLLRRVAAAMGVPVEDLVADRQANAPDWLILRELLKSAGPAQIARARAALSEPEARMVDRQDRRVALIGLRGAGKSTLGRLVAQRLGWPFVELNGEIERETGLSIQEIFALYGQEGYRKFEQAAVRRVAARPGPMILATGGGIVAEPLTFELLIAAFFTVWLKAEPEEHMMRVRQQGDLRPMAEDRGAMGELRTILASREPLYARARVTVDTAGVTVGEAADRLAHAIVSSLGAIESPQVAT
jgi:XRE family aerobic/anaerobic benzoate catabolism transcriptional regulator